MNPMSFDIAVFKYVLKVKSNLNVEHIPKAWFNYLFVITNIIFLKLSVSLELGVTLRSVVIAVDKQYLFNIPSEWLTAQLLMISYPMVINYQNVMIWIN